ncbi:WD40 repeat domain-containing protein [Streptomyces guryensis]|uniref:PQQ-binding-like beta-propeller repeat protein n=1 Tax=Streptomyces guryensis TaxID=2886947 RepID=A0A9Q3ZAX3_9ACTN|nr:PQQ-binding-like beta-propeller repeat protein [Streptomyces guryensis]MCD9879749.1 PQQ-binding-like beta-propeller repeat protein [Streptomyces guryensis]
MGRPERPVDPEAGPIQCLAHELRELRRSAGNPSYRTMAKAAGFSATTLSTAAAGERLPALAVVQGYVRACGGDPGEWEPRWKAAEAQAAGTAREEDGDASPPYRGLTRFEPDDRDLFFGRDRLVEDLQELVCEHRFAAVFGASGSGKSSLLRAGLIPRLQHEIAARGRSAVLRVLTPGDHPATTHGRLLAPAADEPESWVVVDQFEEVFTLCRDRAERARFIDLLLTARDADSRLRVLIAVRADFYARCAEHRGLADALRGAGLLVGPMTADELREAVIKPAQAVGLQVERELTARIVEEVLDQAGGLPMLSHALLETWRRRRGRTLTPAMYEAAGGVRGAIAASAEEAYGQLTAAQRCAARHLLLRMIEPGRGTSDTARPLTRAELDGCTGPDVPVVVERLARARLLTVDGNGVHLAHEALITCWPRLHDWVDQDRERLRHHRALSEAARTWLEHDRDSGTLYRGTRLARAEEFFPEHERGPALTTAEREFLTAAVDAREAERRAAARSTRRARTGIGVLAAVVVVALVAGLSAWTQSRNNERRSTEDAARRIASVADALRTTDPRTAQLLGVAAWRVAQLPESRRALLGSLGQPELDTFSDPAPGEGLSRFLTDSGRTLLSAEGRTWRTWDVAGHRRTGSGRLPEDGKVVGASPDGRLLAVHGNDAVRLWDTAARRWSGQRLPASSLVGFTGHSYVVGDGDSLQVQARSAADGRLLLRTEAESGAVVAPSADGRLVAFCPLDGGLQVRDTNSGRTVHGAWERAPGVCGEERSRLTLGGGERLAAVTGSGVSVFDVGSGEQLADLADAGAQYATFSKDGDFLATADGKEVRIWRLGVDAPVFRHPLNGQQLHGGPVWDSERPVLRYLEGGTVHSLDVVTAVTSAWQDQPLDKVLLSPDGRTLATARRVGDGYRVELREILPHSRPRSSGGTPIGRLLRALPPPPLPVARDRFAPVLPENCSVLLTFGPDGKTLAYGISAPGNDASAQRVTLWDVARGRARTTLDLVTKTPAGAVTTIALGPDARTLYATRTLADGKLSNETWDTAHHRRTAALTALTSSHLAVRPDGRLLVGDNRTAALPGGQVTGRHLVQGDEIGALAFAADGSRLVAGDRTGRVALWDGKLRAQAGVLRNVFPELADGTSDARFGDSSEAISALAVSPDGRTLAVGGEAGSLQLWDIATQQPLGAPVTTPGEAIDTLAFSADSDTVYAGSAHVPLQRYSIDPTRAAKSVCARTGNAGLTRAQWRTYVPGVSYRKVCGD